MEGIMKAKWHNALQICGASWIGVWVALTLVSPVVAGNLITNTATLSTDMRRIVERGSIVVAMLHEDSAPMFMHDEKGFFYGFDVDLARSIAEALNVKPEFQRNALTYDQVVDIVAAGQADIGLSCLSATQKRALKVQFTKPYLKFYQGLVVNRLKTSRVDINRNVDLLLQASDTLLGTIKQSSYVEFSQRYYPKVQLLQYDDWDQAVQEVVKGRIHAAIFDDYTINDWVQNNPQEMLYVQPKILHDKEDPIAIAVHWRDTHLLYWLNLHLETLEATGRLKALNEFYIESDAWSKKPEIKENGK